MAAWERAFAAREPAANLGDARDDDPAVRRAREILRKMHADISTISRLPRFERRVHALLLAHLESGFAPEARGTA
jgi:hypothetical protein